MSNVTPNPDAFKQMAKPSVSLAHTTAEQMVKRMKEPWPIGSPVDSGHNRDSIAMKDNGDGSFKVHTESGYGGWLDIGTARMPARPYFAPAFQFARDTVKRIFGE